MLPWISLWGFSSAGRAFDWQSRGHRFDPDMLHQKSPWNSNVPRTSYSLYIENFKILRLQINKGTLSFGRIPLEAFHLSIALWNISFCLCDIPPSRSCGLLLPDEYKRLWSQDTLATISLNSDSSRLWITTTYLQRIFIIGHQLFLSSFTSTSNDQFFEHVFMALKPSSFVPL